MIAWRSVLFLVTGMDCHFFEFFRQFIRCGHAKLRFVEIARVDLQKRFYKYSRENIYLAE